MNGKKGIGKTLIWILIFGLFFWWLILPLFNSGTEIPASQFQEVIDEGKFNFATITPQNDLLLVEIKILESIEIGDKQIGAGKTCYSRLGKNFDIVSELKKKNIAYKFKAPSGCGGSQMSWFMLLPLIFIFWFLMRAMAGRGAGGMGGGPGDVLRTDRIKAVDKNADLKSWDDIAGCDEAVLEAKEALDRFVNAEKYRSQGVLKTNILLEGQPGTGKTLFAKAFAGEANKILVERVEKYSPEDKKAIEDYKKRGGEGPIDFLSGKGKLIKKKVSFFEMSGSGFVEIFVGVGAGRVRALFEKARQNKPCIIFIDEIDAVGRQRGAGIGGGNDEREQTLNELLHEMDGFEEDDEVLIIAATNRPDILDPALLRPGRFDTHIVLSPPDVKGREAILKIHFRKRKLDESIDFKKLAKETTGLTGAELEKIANEAARISIRKAKSKIDQNDIEDAKDIVLMGGSAQKRELTPDTKETIAYHEAGHALAAYILRCFDQKNTDPLSKVSIIPRGRALGITVQVPEEDKVLYSKKYLFNHIRILLGGRVAEELIAGLMGVTTGSQNDLERATEIARRIVCRWGMSKLGARTFGKETEHPFLGRDILSDEVRNYSDLTARLIDEEIKDIFEKGMKKTQKIISLNKAALNKLAAELMEKETLDGAEVESIIKSAVPAENLENYDLYKTGEGKGGEDEER